MTTPSRQPPMTTPSRSSPASGSVAAASPLAPGRVPPGATGQEGGETAKAKRGRRATPAQERREEMHWLKKTCEDEGDPNSSRGDRQEERPDDRAAGGDAGTPCSSRTGGFAQEGATCFVHDSDSSTSLETSCEALELEQRHCQGVHQLSEAFQLQAEARSSPFVSQNGEAVCCRLFRTISL